MPDIPFTIYRIDMSISGEGWILEEEKLDQKGHFVLTFLVLVLTATSHDFKS